MTPTRRHLAEILDRHDLGPLGQAEAGANPTHPVFVCGDVVVKLYGALPTWARSFDGERAALRQVASDPAIGAPRLLADGLLFEGRPRPWPYLVLSRVPGASLEAVRPTPRARRAVAAQVGARIRRLRALPTGELPTDDDWPAVDPVGAAARSSLPAHLVAQVEDYLADGPAPQRRVVHADLTAAHAFVDEAGRLTGIIDWGDAMVTDPHVELIQAYRALCGCDRDAFDAFLDAAGWSPGPDFPRRALAAALRRQAVGLTQHRSIDVFEPIAAAFPLTEIATLDALAERLFGPATSRPRSP